MTTTADAHPPVVTLATLYGAAGSVIGPRVAGRLGVPFLDRVISERVDVEAPPPTARLGRLSTITGGAGGSFERFDAGERDERARVEQFLAEASRSGGVALGRGGMVVLRSVPWALHVHLGGPLPSRVAQAMALESIDRATADARRRAEDGARISYVRRAYGIDGGDPDWYHLMVDSTALELDVCVELVVAAALARTHDPRPSPTM